MIEPLPIQRPLSATILLLVVTWAVGLLFIIPLVGCAQRLQPVTLAQVEQSATLTTQAADTYVLAAHPNVAARLIIRDASNSLHAAVLTLEATPVGTPLDLAAFDAALAALSAVGVPVKAPAP